MITEDYVSFETAKLLKEKGFDSEVHSFYYVLGSEIGKPGYLANNVSRNTSPGRNFNWENGAWISRPTIQMAMKWLREIHNLYISVEPNHDKEGLHNAYVRRNWWKHNWGGIGYKTYEEACEAAIKYCLENLI